MKLYLSTLLCTLFLFFAPIKGIILVVALATLADTAFGIWSAKKRNEALNSKIFRHGLIPKLVSYIATVMLVYTSDVFIVNDLTGALVSAEFIATKVIALVLISVEVTSMDESFIKVKGFSFIDKIKSVVLKLKNIKKEL